MEQRPSMRSRRLDVSLFFAGQQHDGNGREARLETPDRAFDLGAQLLAALWFVEGAGGEVRQAEAGRRYAQLAQLWVSSSASAAAR